MSTNRRLHTASSSAAAGAARRACVKRQSRRTLGLVGAGLPMKAQINRRVLLGTALLCVFAASSVVADPAGEVLAPGNFIHVVANLDKTIAFHHDVLGLQQANS